LIAEILKFRHIFLYLAGPYLISSQKFDAKLEDASAEKRRGWVSYRWVKEGGVCLYRLFLLET